MEIKLVPLADLIRDVPDGPILRGIRQGIEGGRFTELVRFERRDPSPGECQDPAWLFCGPDATYKSHTELSDRPLGDTPSEYRYPVAYAELPRARPYVAG